MGALDLQIQHMWSSMHNDGILLYTFLEVHDWPLSLIMPLVDIRALVKAQTAILAVRSQVARLYESSGAGRLMFHMEELSAADFPKDVATDIETLT